MTMKDTTKSVGKTLNSAGKTTLKGVGILALGAVKVLGEAADIQRRDRIRKQLESISDYDLAIAIEILTERQDKK